MGGKHKQSQRTKENAKPSSSGRSAALLCNTMSTSGHFSTVKDCGYLPIFQCLPPTTSEELDQNIDSNFQLVLKKMNKKDSTTRLKALQEFGSLVESSDVDAMKAILPFWPRLYCLLTEDLEHRVREAAQEAHRIMVLCTKRNMAPYLRQLAGPWFTAQFDTHPPVATAATRAFHDAFPGNKLIEAIVFCQEDILKHISNSLLEQPSSTNNTSKNVTPDKLKLRQQRVTVSCLQGFTMYLRTVPSKNLEGLCTSPVVQNLIASNQFWKLATEKSTMVRSSWLSVMSAVLDLVPQLVADRQTQVVQAILTRLDETEPSVLPYVWEAALHVLTAIEDWETRANIDKLVLPPLWHVLQEAGHGSASTIFPNLLPVLSCLLKTRKIGADQETLCDQFFNSLRQGFTKKSLIQSRAESEAVAQSYVECLRYVANCGSVPTDQLVLRHLIPAIELLLLNTDLNLLSRSLFEHVSSLVRHWSCNRIVQSCSMMIEQFWSGLSEICQKLPTCSSETLAKLSTSTQEVELCICLKSTSKRRKKVHFGRNTSPETEQVTTPTEEIPADLEFKRELEGFVQQICTFYMNELKKGELLHYIVPLSKLVSAFNSRELFEKLASSHNVLELFTATLQPWLSVENTYQQAMIELAFCLLPHLQSDDKDHVLQVICQVPGMVVWVIRAAREHHKEPHIAQWLHSAWLSKTLLSLACDVSLDSHTDNAKAVLRDCFSKTADEGLLIRAESASSILSQLCSYAPDKDECSMFAAELLSSLCECKLEPEDILGSDLLDSIHRLTVILFISCCQPPKEGQLIPYNTDKAWQKGLTLLMKMQGAEKSELLTEFSKIVKEELITREVLPSRDLNHIVQTAAKVIVTLSESSCLAASCVAFLEGLQPELNKWEHQLTAVCMDAELLAGASNIFVPQTENGKKSVEIARYVVLSAFTIKLISKVVFNIKERRNSKEVKRQQVAGLEALPLKEEHSSQSNNILHPETKNEIEKENSSNLKNLGDQTSIQKLDDTVEDRKKSERPTLSLKLNMQTEPGPSMKQPQTPEGEKQIMGIVPDMESLLLLRDNIIQVVVSLAICKVFERHYQSTHYYNKITLQLSSLRMSFEKVAVLLHSAGKLSYLEEKTIENAKEHGGIWVWAHYLLYRDEEIRTAFATLMEVGQTEYACQVLMALSENEFPLSLFGDSPSTTTVRCWLLQQEDQLNESTCCLILGPLKTWMDLGHAQLLHDCDVSKKTWSEVEQVSQVIHSLAIYVAKCPQFLTQSCWDFIILSAAYYIIQTLQHSHHLLLPSNLQDLNVLEAQSLTSSQEIQNVAVFTVAACDLFVSLAQFMSRVVQENDEAYVQIADEWNAVFAKDIHHTFLKIFKEIADSLTQLEVCLVGHQVLQALCSAVDNLETDFFKTEYTNKQQTESLLKVFCQLMHSSVCPVQTASYSLLKKLLPVLVLSDTLQISILDAEESDSEVDVSKLQITPILKELQDTQAVVDIVLADFSFGDSCIVQPHTDSHSYATAYLLLWDLLLDACGQASSELRYHYVTIFRDCGCLHQLLEHVFRLMPAEVLEPTCPKHIGYMFQEAPNLPLDTLCSSEQLQHWACWVYFCILRRLPALVRQWWSDTKPKVNNVVQRATHQYVTPHLCNSEWQTIQNNNTKLKNMEVKVHSRAREVVAVYAVDENRMELVISLPETYPLGTVQVNSHTPLVTTNQWRNWVRQLSIFLTHQNGSVWDGLLLWKSNLDKRFEGVEECYICFSIVHGTNFQIPKLCCKTCKKKFHSPCLFKWFSTSNKSTCPICRNMF